MGGGYNCNYNKKDADKQGKPDQWCKGGVGEWGRG